MKKVSVQEKQNIAIYKALCIAERKARKPEGHQEANTATTDSSI